MSRETQHREIVLENEICDHLTANDWYYSSDDTGYDANLALFPEDVFKWLQDSQPDEFEKIVRPSDPVTQQEKSKLELLRRLAKVLDIDPFREGGGGSLATLRHGFNYVSRRGGSAKFQMAQFKPATSLNPATTARYDKMRLRVMRQVHYSVKSPAKSLDLVFFINGIPIATAELKTELTQSADNAVIQYRKDRPTAGEPLLSFGKRALVHFVVTNEVVMMTTKLEEAKTRFLPFNQGNRGASGNPLNPNGSATSYFWEETLQKDAWLNLFHRFVQTSVEEEYDHRAKKKVTKKKIIFPRYHQWRAVTRLIDTAAVEGPGHKYLIQHSAGSGKSNSIAWLAHQLSNLHDDTDKPVFDTVVVVTDRTVLDRQLRENIEQFEHKQGVVVAITRDSGQSKSQELTEALESGAKIVIVTIQTFLPTIGLIQQSKKLQGKSFAVIADEAHSSQTGSTAGAVKKVLSQAEQEDLEDGGAVDAEAFLAAAMSQAADSTNISYFAFTATPKAKTIELFGRYPDQGAIISGDLNPDVPGAFDVYTMQQAIEENFILDVLRNYTSYDTAWRIAHPDLTPNDDEVDEATARKSLVQWVQHHPENIATKVKVIVDHFRGNVAHLLDGNAKAMVVTSSRKQAVRYKRAFDHYLQKLHIDDVKALVAFSGTVDDTGPEGVGEGLTEANMNPETRGRDLAEEFKGTMYSVMIVANKYQTGFDQPLLSAMYVDKQLAGVQAVQTLSRLNRTAPGKEQTFVLDFVNDPEEILASFKPYYREAQLTDVSDPNQLNDLATKLDGQGIYRQEELRQFADDWIANAGNSKLHASVASAAKRFASMWLEATDNSDKKTQEKLVQFKADVGSYVRYYEFISQILDLGDTDLLRRHLFFRLLHRQLVTREEDEFVDISGVELVDYRVKESGKKMESLGGTTPLDPISAIGTGVVRDKHRDALARIIQKLNERFGDKFSNDDLSIVFGQIINRMVDDSELAKQARVNTAKKFAESTSLLPALIRALLGTRKVTPEIIDELMKDEQLMGEISHEIGPIVRPELRKRQDLDEEEE